MRMRGLATVRSLIGRVRVAPSPATSARVCRRQPRGRADAADARPRLADAASRFVETRARRVGPMSPAGARCGASGAGRARLAEATHARPICCGQPMRRHDRRPVQWLTWVGVGPRAESTRYRCADCRAERRPLLETARGRAGAAERLARPATRVCSGCVASYPLAAQLGGPALRRHGQRDDRLARGAAAGRSGRAPHRGARGVSRRRPQPGARSGRCAGRGGRRRRWLHAGDAGADHATPPARRRDAPAVTAGRRRALPRSQNRGAVAPGRTRRSLAGPPHAGAARPGDLSGRRRQALCSALGAPARDGLARPPDGRRRDRGRVGVDLAPRPVVCPPLRDPRLLARDGIRVGLCTAPVWRRGAARRALDAPGRPRISRAATCTP